MTEISRLQSVPCPLCDTNQFKEFYCINEFHIVRCTNCSMVFVNPRLNNELLYDFYKNDYFFNEKKGYINYDLTAGLRMKTFRRWYTEMKPFLRKGSARALDIGCAAGYFLDILKQDGWNAEGVELDTKMLAQVGQKGYTVYNTPIEYFTLEKRYDLISLFDVVEHLPNLHADFGKMVNLLEKNGILVLVTPNIQSLQRRIFGKRWFQFKPHEHISYFTPKTIQTLAQKHQLRIRLCQPSGQYADTTFILNRLNRYGFKWIAGPLSLALRIFGLKEKSWYADTGSMLVVLEKKE